jgi:hypothetical protein
VTARTLQDRFELRLPLIHASAEQAPCADATFDVAISECGASIWRDPYAWIPEAVVVRRPEGCRTRRPQLTWDLILAPEAVIT